MATRYDLEIRITTKKKGNAIPKTNNQLGKLAKNLAKTAAAFAVVGVAVHKASRFMSESIDLYRIQEKAEAQLESAITSTGMAAGLTAEELKAMASGLQEVTTFGDEAIIGGQSLLLTFTNIGEDVFPRATETMLDMSQALGQDMKSSAIQLGKALNDPVLGVTALRRVGIQLTKEQENQIKTFVELGDVASAQNLILDELSTQMGGSARAAAETLTGQLDQQANAWGDVKEQLGGELIESLVVVRGALFGIGETVLTNLIPQINDFNTSIEALGGTNNEVAASIIADNLEMAKSIEDLVEEAQKLKEVDDLMFGLATTITGTSEAVSEGQAGVAKGFAEEADTIEEFNAAMIEGFGSMEEGLIPAAHALNLTDEELQQLTKDGKSWTDVLFENTKYVQAGEAAIDGWAVGLLAATSATEGSIEPTRQLSQITGELSDKLQQATILEGERLVEIRHGEAAVRAGNAANEEYFTTVEQGTSTLSAWESASGQVFTSVVDSTGKLDFFNESIADLERQFVSVGGRTGEQTEALGKLRDQYESAAETVRDYEFGVKGANLTDEERNEKIAEQQVIMGGLLEVMGPLTGITSELVAVNSELTINQDGLNEALFAAAGAADTDAREMALLGGALGLYTEEAVEAALKTALIQGKIDELGASYEAGTTNVHGMQQELRNFINTLDEIPEEVNVNVNTKYTTTGTPPLGSSAAGTFPGSGGSAAAGGGASNNLPNTPAGPFNAQGASYIIPPGFNENFPIGFGSSGEEVNITPKGQRGGGITVENLNVSISGSNLQGTRETAQAVATQVVDILGDLN